MPLISRINLPQGTTIPGKDGNTFATFSYLFTFEEALSPVTGEVIPDVIGPAITGVGATFHKGDQVSSSDPNHVITVDNDKHMISVDKRIDLLPFLEQLTFPQVGYYFYTVTEEKTGFLPANHANTIRDYNDGLEYAQESYMLKVSVFQNDTGFYVKGYSFDILTDRNGATGSGKTNEAAFTKKYNRWTSLAPLYDGFDYDAPLNAYCPWIINRVLNSPTESGYFPYYITINYPHEDCLVRERRTPGAVLLKQDGSNWRYEYSAPIANIVFGNGYTENKISSTGAVYAVSTSFSFTSTNASTEKIRLRPNYALGFSDFPVGTSIQVVADENVDNDSYAAIYASYPSTKIRIVSNGCTAPTDISGKDSGVVWITENPTSIQIIHQFEETIMTGIMVNNLPYLVMVALAAGVSLLLIVGSTKRKRHK